jgi:hypothetical protein
MKNLLKIVFTTSLIFQLTTNCKAQLTPINFEPTGYGANWTWRSFENTTNLPPQIVANPNTTGINASPNVIKMTTLVTGQPWAGFESLHPGSVPPGPSDIGIFTLNASNAIVKLMVYKSVISDVGVKFATASGASTGELKKPNTLINQWEELTFDFSSQIGNTNNTNIDQIIIFPDFNSRSTDNDCYIDNVTLGSGTTIQNMNVKFAIQNVDSLPVYVFGNWNNWSNFPGTPMVFNTATGNYEITIPLASNSTVEYLYVNGNLSKETLNSTWPCTNGNAQYTNRKATLGAVDTTICNQWETCSACFPLTLNNAKNENVSIFLNSQFIRINATNISQFEQLEIFDLLGKKVFGSNGIFKTNQNISVNLKSNTFYIVRLKNGNDIYKVKSFINN